MEDRERDLADAADELAETLESLRAELREPPRGPLGLPRPPTPREFLRFTERYTIPATISLLEAGIRTLELLAAAIRVADGRALESDSTDRGTGTTPGTDRVAAASRRTLAALDDALADLQSAAAGGEPSNPEIQRLLSEARDLRDEVDDRLADATAENRATGRTAEPVNIEVELGEDEAEEAGADGSTGDHAGDVDVDRELESIKREFDESKEHESGNDDGEADLERGADHGEADREDESRGDGRDDDEDGGAVDDTDFREGDAR